MMRNMVAVVAGLGLIFGLMGCGGGKYSDIIEVNRQFVKLMSNYVEAVDKVDSADEAAKAINDLADGMEKLAPEMKAIQKKYPELADAEELPEELEMTEEEMEKVGQKFGNSFMKLMPYMSNQKVQQAQERLTRVMSTLGEE